MAAVDWARESMTPGTPAWIRVREGISQLLGGVGGIELENPTSGLDDGRNPASSSVLLVTFPSSPAAGRYAIKFSDESPEAIDRLKRQVRILKALWGRTPVPAVIAAELDSEQFGLPALVTTADGTPLIDEYPRLSETARTGIVRQLAGIVRSIHLTPLEALGIGDALSAAEIQTGWREDALWYRRNASRAGQFAPQVEEWAGVLENQQPAPGEACLVHRDIHPYNVLVRGEEVVAVVDWDFAGVSSPYEDVAKAAIGLLTMMNAPREEKSNLARSFVHAYAAESASDEALLRARLKPFALDTLLDWIVGGKNAPRSELVWAAVQMLGPGAS